jgi:microcystin-dependent protein
MKHLLTCLALIFAINSGAQSYPWNPDSGNDQFIGYTDFLDILSIYGNDFSPSEILIDGVPLSVVITDLQNSIDSISSLFNGIGESHLPLGTVLPFAAENAPENWLLCFGQEISIENHQELYNLVGTTYGAGDSAVWALDSLPATTFNLPDLRGRTIIGVDNMGGEEAGRVQIETYPFLGGTGGADQHSLSISELPDLSFYIPGASYTSSYSPNEAPGLQTGPPDGGLTMELGGESTSFSKMQPYMALNYIIKVL